MFHLQSRGPSEISKISDRIDNDKEKVRKTGRVGTLLLKRRRSCVLLRHEFLQHSNT